MVHLGYDPSMNWNWSTHRVASILGLPESGTDQKIRSITTDSRAVNPGDLFVAIRGDSLDGHDFIPKAVAAGAVAILSARTEHHPGVATFQVEDTLAAVRKLAGEYRRQFKIPLIGVVGAVGKTTTKELIASVLQGRFSSVLKTEGSQNGFLGIPLTLLQLNAGHEIGIIEIGIDEIGAMDQHLDLVEPTHLILTRTGPEHLHQLKTVEIAAREELRAFDHGLARGIPLAINLSDPFVKAWYAKHRAELARIPHPTYSMAEADLADNTGRNDADEGTLFIRTPPGTSAFRCPLPGEHHAHNLLAAIVVSRFFGLSDAEIAAGISTFKTAYGRTELHPLPGGGELIGDHYNSNPASLAAALKLLREKKGAPQYHAVLGDMLELGEEEERFHREIIEPVRDFGITHLWLFGPRMKALLDEVQKKPGFAPLLQSSAHFERIEDLAAALNAQRVPGARILLKGSRGMKMERVLDALLPGRSAP